MVQNGIERVQQPLLPFRRDRHSIIQQILVCLGTPLNDVVLVVLIVGFDVGRDLKTEEIMRLVELNGGLVLGQRPLDFLPDAREHRDDVLTLAEADDGELAGGQFDAPLLVDEVDYGAGDSDEDFLGGFECGGRLRLGVVRVLWVFVVREEILSEVFHVDGWVDGGWWCR